MDFFNYVMVLASVIIGLAVTHLLQGVAKLIQDPDRPRLYWVHCTWIGLMFLNALFWWWWQFSLSRRPGWTFEFYLFVISFAVLLYLICAVLVPSTLRNYADYRAYYFSRRRWLFGLLLAFSLFDLLDSAFKGWSHLVGLGWLYFVSVLVRSVLMIVAMQSRSARFHGFVVLAFLADLGILIFRNFHMLH
ncbi:hypothetical protein OMW55_10885 [Sphingomonas sp. BN140010]|uniref:Uncharacterized protein n=1 Tax=Sphingomonas arvum TaxID=2992113 RepID=A0ABT3JGU7_9SPHN|nr:hypothetical protein [Sphingomonas sp. BN140010]MCW3798307.1 hypothetical protein [Sphingomonas sp. BN140010]